jgi:ribonuclease HI
LKGFILAINPALKWISKPGKGYSFLNGIRVSIIAYCDDIALVGSCAAEVQAAFDQLVAYGKWIGLEINPTKSAYTNARGRAQAVLKVPGHREGIPHATVVPWLPPTASYRYMGVLINANLEWTDHLAHIRKKVAAYQHLIRNKRLTTSNKVYISNVVTNAFVAYGMCVVPYPKKWLLEVQAITLATIKSSMRVPRNADDEPFFMPVRMGGRGLVSLVDLQSAHACSNTLRELTTVALSSTTIGASWQHAYAIKNSHIERWVHALRDQGWQAWPRLRDLDWIGHFAPDPALAYSLVGRGICRWSQLVHNGRLRPRDQILDAAGTAVSLHTYTRIARAIAGLPRHAALVEEAEDKLRKLNTFSPRVGELQDLHYHHPSNTLTIFTDGSCKDGSTAAGVFFGPGSRRNRSFRIAAEPVSMVAELHAIEEALVCAPATTNVCIATDSKAGIDAITGWLGKPAKHRRTCVGAGVLARIQCHLDEYKTLGREVHFQHIYSHISRKKSTAAAQGQAEVRALAKKLDFLKNQLWGPFERWVAGNEGADKLADQGHASPPILGPWVVPACSPDVVLFDGKGCIVEGNIARKVLQKESGKWVTGMKTKPARGAALRAEGIDRGATHAALDLSPLPRVRRMANFLHKARYGMLPVKNTRHHLYWRRSGDGAAVAMPPPEAARGEEARLNKWIARQHQYQSQICELCAAGARETTEHALTDECSHGRHVSSDTAADVLQLIQAQATKGVEHVDHIPLWFPAGVTPNGLSPCEYAPFTELRAFNKLWGALGYVPAPLSKALDYFGVADKKLLTARIAQRVATGAFLRWGERCTALTSSAGWLAASVEARRTVEVGIG